MTETLTRTPSVRWPASLGDTVLLRANPVPGRRLADPDLRRDVATLTDAYARMTALAGAACDALYALAGPLVGKERHEALGLKRAIFNGREPGQLSGRDWPEPVAEWLAASTVARDASARIRTGYPAALAGERTTLADAIGHPAFRRGLSLTAPLVLDAVDRYREDRADAGARNRKSERGLLQYLTRAMVRTSPLSWFTTAGFAVWSPAGPPLDEPLLPFDRARSFVSVDRVLFTGVITGMLRTPGDRDAATVTFNPTLRVSGDRIRFQQRDGDVVRLVETRMTAQVGAIVELTAIGPVPVTDLAAALADRFGATAEEAQRLVRAALGAQILTAGPAIDEQAADPVPLAAHALDGSPAVPLLAGLERELTTVAGGGLRDRVQALRRVTTIQDRLNETSTRPARLHLNEDVMLPTGTVTERGYRQSLHDLSGVLELAGVFETNLMLRCLLGAVVVERYGPGANVGLIECAEDLSREVAERARQLTSASAAGYTDPAWPVRGLLETRERARAILVDAIRAHRDDEEVWLPSDAFRDLAAEMPETLRRRPASYGLLVQPHHGRLLLNGAYGGRNLLGMRFLGPAAAIDADLASADVGRPLDARVAERVRRLYGDDGVRLREDHQLHSSNINHRIRLLDDVIEPRDWLGLRLRHDPHTGDLDVIDADGAPTRILYLGMRWIETLPPPLRIAMWLTDTGQVAFDPIGWAHRPDLAQGSDQPVRYPRLVA
ncbi:MAG TPA: lantibiotic dehydratase, partial [Micromonosporaceae bacterium]